MPHDELAAADMNTFNGFEKQVDAAIDHCPILEEGKNAAAPNNSFILN